MARFKFLLAFFAFMICAGGVAGAYFFWKKFAEPDIVVNRQLSGDAAPREKPDLGKRHFDRAIDLAKEGELVSARDRLLYLMEYFPESKTYPDAKRIVGELNLDLLLSRIPQPGKTIHVVRRGEALVTIARKNETTIDYIMRTNAKSNSLIYPDEELTVFPLKLRAEIDLTANTVVVYDGDTFFKEYAILDRHLPPDLSAPISTTIKEKVAWFGDRPVNFIDENYMNCSKWIRSGKIGLFIREYREGSEKGERSPYGVMVKKADLEELFTILRHGSRIDLVK